jgi:hypothetical protein
MGMLRSRIGDGVGWWQGIGMDMGKIKSGEKREGLRVEKWEKG